MSWGVFRALGIRFRGAVGGGSSRGNISEAAKLGNSDKGPMCAQTFPPGGGLHTGVSKLVPSPLPPYDLEPGPLLHGVKEKSFLERVGEAILCSVGAIVTHPGSPSSDMPSTVLVNWVSMDWFSTAMPGPPGAFLHTGSFFLAPTALPRLQRCWLLAPESPSPTGSADPGVEVQGATMGLDRCGTERLAGSLGVSVVFRFWNMLWLTGKERKKWEGREGEGRGGKGRKGKGRKREGKRKRRKEGRLEGK